MCTTVCGTSHVPRTKFHVMLCFVLIPPVIPSGVKAKFLNQPTLPQAPWRKQTPEFSQWSSHTENVITNESVLSSPPSLLCTCRTLPKHPSMTIGVPTVRSTTFYYLPGVKGCNFVFLLHGHLTKNFVCKFSWSSPLKLRVLHVSFHVVNPTVTFKVVVMFYYLTSFFTVFSWLFYCVVQHRIVKMWKFYFTLIYKVHTFVFYQIIQRWNFWFFYYCRCENPTSHYVTRYYMWVSQNVQR